jgi:PST family polysaccharide transporter
METICVTLMPQSSYFEDLKQSPELGRLALRGGTLAIASTYASGVLQVVSAVVLARLLAPEDFGLVAIVTLVISFSPFVIDFGLGDATTQTTKITPEQVSCLFWISNGIGFSIAAFVALSSPIFAWIFHEPRLEAITLYSAATFLLLGLSGQHLALLRRTMQFGAIAKIQILSNLAALTIAIPLALYGFGYWALVQRPIVFALVTAAGAWLACRWRPGLPVFDKEVKSMVRFGMHIVGYAVVNSVARAVDRIVLGLFCRPREVGFYHNALILYENSIVSALAQLHSVGSAALSKLQATPAELRQKYDAALSTLAFFVMPSAVILSVTAQDLVVILLGETWRESGLLLSIIALRGIFHVIQGSQGWLHLSAGRPDRWKRWGIVTAIVQVLAILSGAPFGPTGVAIAFVLVGWLMAFPSISYAGRPIGIGAELVTRSVGRQLVGAIISAAAGWLLQTFVFADLSALSRILLAATSCISIYLLLVAGLFRLTEPINVAGRFIQDQLSRRSKIA